MTFISSKEICEKFIIVDSSEISEDQLVKIFNGDFNINELSLTDPGIVLNLARYYKYILNDDIEYQKYLDMAKNLNSIGYELILTHNLEPNTLIELYKDKEIDSIDPKVLCNIGYAYLHINDLQNAFLYYNKASNLMDDQPNIYLTVAKLRCSLEMNINETIELVEKSSMMGCIEADTLLLLLYFKTSNFEKAIEAIKRTRDRNLNNAQYLVFSESLFI